MTKLGFFTNAWANAPIATNEFITPKDGQYRVIIEKVDYAEQDNEGNECDPTFVFTFTIKEGENEGLKFRRFTTLRNEKSFSYFKRDLQIIGIPIPRDPEELPNVTRSAVGVIIEVTIKSRMYNDKKYKDVYFDKRIGKEQRQEENPFLPPEQRPQANRQTATQYQQPPQYQQQQRSTQQWAQQPAAFNDVPFNPNDYDNQIPF